MRALLLALMAATCTPLAPSPSPAPAPPDDAGAPAPTVPAPSATQGTGGVPPVAQDPAACSAAFNRRKELGCPPAEGSAWKTSGCLAVSAAALKCMALAPNCLAATECK